MNINLYIFGLSIFATVLITMSGLIIVEPTIFTIEIIPESPPPELGAQTANGTFYWPRGVAVNGTNFIFVADTQNSRGQILFPNGTFWKVFGFPGDDDANGSLNRPYGLGIDNNNNVYVANTFSNNIKVYDDIGTYLTTLFTGGTTNGTLYYPSDVAFNGTVSPSEYFVADTYNNRLQVFNHTSDPLFNNKFIRTIP